MGSRIEGCCAPQIGLARRNRRGAVGVTAIPMNRSPLLRLALLLLLLAAGTNPVAAHVVEQLFGEFRRDEGGWRIELWFDAGYAEPEARADSARPQPAREWLVGLKPADQVKLVGQAEDYLRGIVRLQDGDGEPLAWRVSCPDLRTEPPDFPSLLNDGAYFRLWIEPAAVAEGDGLVIGLADGKHPDLVLKTGDGERASYRTLRAGESQALLDPVAPAGRGAVAEAFVQGFLHVIPEGLDHILFVLGIFLLRRCWQPLLAQSLAFTAAHTITLGLAAAGILRVAGPVVEPLIALSITALAVENLIIRKVGRWRLGLVFAFGLIHGLGFAGALEKWIPRGEGFAVGLLAANLGVEAGQLVVLLLAWGATHRWHRGPAWETVRRGSCVMLALTGLWWFAERVAG